ncbi:hypothetical protein MD484_g5599, partial [Candolleomyces efflorescens]
MGEVENTVLTILTANGNVVALIDRLPIDVLSEIFLFCLPSYLWEMTMDAANAPVLLTHVCRRWREIATSVPLLWAGVKLSFRVSEAAECQNSKLRLWSDWSSRSIPAPLSLQIDLEVKEYRSYRALATIPVPLNNLLLHTSHTLTRLALSCVRISELRTLSPALFPSLEILVMRLNQRDRCREGELIEAFQEAPSLRRVAISEWKILPESRMNVALPLQQLTHYVIGHSVKDFRAFLGPSLPSLANLRYLFVHFGKAAGLETTWNRISTPVRLKNVEGLALTYAPQGITYPDILDKVSLPNLRSLQIHGMEMDLFASALHPVTHARWSHDQAHRFLTKLENFRHLESLGLEVRFNATTTSLRALFDALPRLTRLDILIGGWGHIDCLELLTLKSDGLEANLLPHLRTLIVGITVGAELDTKVLDDFLRSRLLQCDDVRLKTFVFYTFSKKIQNHQAVCQVLQSYECYGLCFEYVVYDDSMAGQNWIQRDPGMRDWPEVKTVVEPYYY